MALSISKAVEQIKGDVSAALPGDVIVMLCRQLNYHWRERCLDPVTTIHAFLTQVLHGNTSCDHVPHLMGKKFTGEAYCMARSRLPLELFQRLSTATCAAFNSCCNSEGWHGHRIWLTDGSSCSMPDTDELQEAFGQPGGQKKGCGFPVAHLLALFDFHTGFLLKVCAAPMRTHDMSQIERMHDEMQSGDLLVADRGFCSYAHLSLLSQRGIQGLFRLHQRTIVSFQKGRAHAPKRPRKNQRSTKGLPKSRWVKWLGQTDQIVEYVKPHQRPDWMTAQAYAALPESLLVRELRYRIVQKGCRTKEVTLVTTLLDNQRYSSQDLAELYASRWKVETNLKHLKQTLKMDVLRTKSLNNVLKELTMYALVYNLVRLVMLEAAQRQQVPVERISFIDALRWLCHAKRDTPIDDLLVIPKRRNRYEPRVRKRRPKNYPLMNQARDRLRKRLSSKAVNS